MKLFSERRHSIDSLFMILLLGIFTLFMILLLLFCARAYQTSVDGINENRELRTAITYLTTKIHQHDTADDVFYGEVEGSPALCLRDETAGKAYITYIFLDDGELKELFTSADHEPSKQLGTAFCPMQTFEIVEKSNGIYQFFLTDRSGHSGNLLLHPGFPTGGAV